MSSLLYTRPAEARAPETEVLPDSRVRLTRFFDTASTKEIPKELAFAWGSLDVFPQGDLAAAWQGLRLTGRKLTDELGPKGRDTRPLLQLIYEQIAPSAETAVGGTEFTHMDDGRVAKVLNYLQFSTGTYSPGTVGSSTSPGDSSYFLLKEEAPDDGTLRKITRTYVTAGILQTDDQLKNNGALEIQTITSAITVPTTPAGFTLIGQPVQHPGGYPIWTYTYAKGNGEVSRSTEYRLSENAGTTGMTVVTIKYLSAPGVVVSPITGPGGYATIDNSYENADGYKVWTGIFATGTGTVINTQQYTKTGKVVIYSKTALNGAPSTPSATIGGTVALIDAETRRDRFHEGQVIYEYRWAEGNGLIEQQLHTRQDGLLEVTNISIGTRSAPSGIIVRDDYTDGDGYIIYTVSAMQTAAGGSDPTGATLVFDKYVPFTYPGRAKAFAETVSGKTMLSHFISPPVATQVLATVTISYQTTNTLGSIGTYWNPTDWATVKAAWTGSYGRYASQIEALTGYRSVSSTPVTFTGSGFDSTIYGHIIYNATTASITITGGPADPGGATLTLHAELELAFTSTTGTKYYRKTVVSAAIPTQTALPV